MFTDGKAVRSTCPLGKEEGGRAKDLDDQFAVGVDLRDYRRNPRHYPRDPREDPMGP